MFLGLSHIGKEIECEVTNKIKLSLNGGPQGVPKFFKEGVMDRFGPKLWTRRKNSHARAARSDQAVAVGLGADYGLYGLD